MIALVSVEKTAFSGNMLYSYEVPRSMLHCISVGLRAFVPFGKRNSLRRSFIIKLLSGNENPELKLKEIDSLIDEIPLLDKNSIDLALKVSDFYFCTLYDSLSLFLPVYIKDSKLELEKSSVCISEVVLSTCEQVFYEKISSWFFDSSNTIKEGLLYGRENIKTKIFLKLAQDVVLNNKKVLILVPEISLIPKMFCNVEKFFGHGSCACLHSGLKYKEHAIEWKKIKNELVKIVIGTRSAIFSPFVPDLIIIDEEQETSYQSDKSPKFNVRDISRFLCDKYGSKILLASSTPSVKTFYFAKLGKIELFKFKERYEDFIFPEIKIVNVSKNYYDAKSILSLELIEHLYDTISSGGQCILLMNRRGLYTFARCSQCGETLKCEKCNAFLVCHKLENQNRFCCHHCGFIKNASKICPKCGKSKIILMGVGTQAIEEEIKKIFPKSRCIRVDSDNIKSRGICEKIFNDFRNHKYDIMVGTRMVAKGLGIENVNLVSILYIDHLLSSGDYKSCEQLFSLISQVSESCMSKNINTKVLIQTFSKDNPIVGMAIKQDYESFFDREINIRRLMLYPPFADICVIEFLGTNKDKMNRICLFFFEILKQTSNLEFSDIPLKILPPKKNFLLQKSNKFRFKIIIKCKNDNRFRLFLKKSIFNFKYNFNVHNIRDSFYELIHIYLV